MNRCAFVLLLALQPLLAHAGPWLDQSFEVFLTPALRPVATGQRDFPVFWWNFLVLESAGTEQETLDLAGRICAGLNESRDIARLPCRLDARALAGPWLADTPLRRPYPGTDELERAAQASMLRAALPLPRPMLELLRLDPLGELPGLQRRIEQRLAAGFERRGAMLFDKESGRALIPVQFAFPPSEGGRTRQALDEARALCAADGACRGIELLGGHNGNMENEMQIRADVGIVSAAGTIALAMLIAFLLWSRRHRLLLLLPLLGVAVAFATTATIALFGSIHAITLSFGPGLVGLAMDYGIHAAFLGPESKPAWRSNLMALLTSLVIMVLLGFSAIPLLQQMMFFAVVGLTLSYVLFYRLMTRYPRSFEAEPLPVEPKPWPLMAGASAMLVVLPALLWPEIRLGVEHLNFESAKAAELRAWFFANTQKQAPFTVADREGLKEWAVKSGIRYDGPADFLPPVAEQEKNLATWRAPCEGGLFRDPAAAKFFAPFAAAACGVLKPRAAGSNPPEYVADFSSGSRAIAVLFPEVEQHARLIKESHPDAASIRELVASFPVTFSRELAWMLPAALGGAFAFLLLYYRRVGPALLAYVPFLAGIGCFALMSVPLGLPVTFISLMGLLMVFGFSLDYGIFAVDCMLSHGRRQHAVWSALALCALSTLAGFAPMAAGQHPVLNSLGHALLWGSVGTYIGTFWGVPAGYRLFYRDAEKVIA